MPAEGEESDKGSRMILALGLGFRLIIGVEESVDSEEAGSGGEDEDGDGADEDENGEVDDEDEDESDERLYSKGTVSSHASKSVLSL